MIKDLLERYKDQIFFSLRTVGIITILFGTILIIVEAITYYNAPVNSTLVCFNQFTGVVVDCPDFSLPHTLTNNVSINWSTFTGFS